MATTFADIVRGAYRRTALIRDNAQPSAAEAQNGLDACNDMMHAWVNDGVDIGHTSKVLSDTFSLADRHVQGVKALLAVRMAEEHGDEIGPVLARDAETGWAALQAEYFGDVTAGFDGGMHSIHMGSEAENDDEGTLTFDDDELAFD